MYVSAVLSLCCCPQAFSSCSKQGPLFVEVHGLLTAVASLAVDYRLQAHRLSGGGSRAPSAGSVVVVQGPGCPKACGFFLGPGIKPVSPALAGGFFLTGAPGKPLFLFF